MSWIDHAAAVVQAICAVLGIVGLAVYTYLTWGLRSTSMRQVTASQRPLLVLLKPDKNKTIGHFVENMGNGPAMGITWKVGVANVQDGVEKVWNQVGSLAVSDWSDLPHWLKKEARLITMPRDGIRIHYADLQGNYYCLTARPTHDDLPDEDVIIIQNECTLLKKDCLHPTTN